MNLRRKPKPEPWWVQSIQGPWLPVLWESGGRYGTTLALEDALTFLMRSRVDGVAVGQIETVRIIRYPRSWWRRLLLRLAGVL